MFRASWGEGNGWKWQQFDGRPSSSADVAVDGATPSLQPVSEAEAAKGLLGSLAHDVPMWGMGRVHRAPHIGHCPWL